MGHLGGKAQNGSAKKIYWPGRQVHFRWSCKPYSCSIHCILPCFMRCKAFSSRAKGALQTLQSVSCSIRCILIVSCYAGDSRAYQQKNCKPYSFSIIYILQCSVRCTAFLSRAKGPCKPYSQLFNFMYFSMLSAMQGIPEHSQRGFTNPTVSQLFNSLYFNVFAAMQGTPGHTNRRIANPTVAQLSTFSHALCYARHS